MIKTLIVKIKSILHKRKEIKQRIRDYAQFALSNEDYDYVFLFDIFRFKLKRMQNYFNEKESCEAKNKILKSIRISIKLCDRIIRDEYTYNRNYHYRNISKYETKSAEILNFKQLLDMDDKHRERDITLLFKTISKYYGLWWY
jgi:hypothetical protein